MSQRFGLPMARIKYRGVFDYDNLTRAMRQWILDSGYEFQELQYKHKVPSPLGYEQEMRWAAWRKVSGYVKYHINIYFHLWDVKDLEVIKDNHKKRMWSARVLIEIGGDIETDWNNYFENGKFLLAIRDWINKYMMFNKIMSSWGDEHYYRVYKLHLVAKQALGMTTITDSSRYRY